MQITRTVNVTTSDIVAVFARATEKEQAQLLSGLVLGLRKQMGGDARMQKRVKTLWMGLNELAKDVLARAGVLV